MNTTDVGSLKKHVLAALPRAVDYTEQYLVEKAGKIAIEDKTIYPFGEDPEVNSDLRIMVAADDQYACCKVLGGTDSSSRTVTSGVGTLFRIGDMRMVLEIDGTVLTNARTALVSAVAARRFAPSGSRSVLVIGAGSLCSYQCVLLQHCLPEAGISLYDVSREACEEVICELKGIGVHRPDYFSIVADLDSAVASADVIVTLTPSRTPIFALEGLSPPVHINAIGSDTKGKRELATDILTEAMLIVDSEEQSQLHGEQNVPLSNGEIEAPLQAITLCDALAAPVVPERRSRITVFDATGLASQDLLFMRWVFETGLTGCSPHSSSLLSSDERSSSQKG